LNCGLSGEGNESEVMRMKYSLELGPMVGLMLKVTLLCLLTSIEASICWTSVCWMTFPTKIPTSTGPTSARVGPLLSSIQLRVKEAPPLAVVPPVGLVMKTPARAWPTRKDKATKVARIFLVCIENVKRRKCV